MLPKQINNVVTKIQMNKNLIHIVSLFLLFNTKTSFATSMSDEAIFDACMAEITQLATAERTVGELRKQCEEQKLNSFEKRLLLEKHASSNPFAILPHKPNYVLPFTYSEIDHKPYNSLAQGKELDNTEMKFQVSLKYIALEDWLINDLNVEFAFTATSWWQAYNSDISSPFRETNYEPELIFNFQKSWSLLGLAVESSYLSLNHQSNGQAGQLSRSWNRVIGGLAFSSKNIIWGISAWWHLPESDKTSATDTTGDDNPNIEKYSGYGELGMLWQVNDGNNLDMILRNNLRSNNKGSVLLGWSFPLTKHLRGYLQYFNGYGESLIYYDRHSERLGIGVKLTDWL